MSKITTIELQAALKSYDAKQAKEPTERELRDKFEEIQAAFHAKGKELAEKEMAKGKVKWDYHTYNYSRGTKEFRISVGSHVVVQSAELQKLQHEMEEAREALQASYRQLNQRVGRSLLEVQKEIEGWKADLAYAESTKTLKPSYNVRQDVLRELGIL